MAQGYNIPSTRRHQVEETISRSRFIATAGHAPSAEEARAFVDAVRAEFPDATHNCWAFAAGPAGDTAHVGMSDDGEPHGTAGRPMLNVLLHSGVGEIAVVVTRYYGGVKLGTGGLVRAYSGLVQLALDSLPTHEKVDTVCLRLTVEYTFAERVKRLGAEHGVMEMVEDYGEKAVFAATLPVDRAEGFAVAVTDATNGTTLIQPA